MPDPTDGVSSDAPTILVVDDEPALLRLMEFTLARQGYRMLTASNGDEALEVFRASCPDLIILDIMMPRLDGYAVAEAVRSDADRERARTPIVMLSARAQDEDIARGLATGAETYVTKPFEPERLTAIVAALLRGEPVPQLPAPAPVES